MRKAACECLQNPGRFNPEDPRKTLTITYNSVSDTTSLLYWQITRVTDGAGRSIILQYDTAAPLYSLIDIQNDTFGTLMTFEYDAQHRLAYTTQLDTGGLNLTRSYHYDEVANVQTAAYPNNDLPYHLTSISDENHQSDNTRYENFQYDDWGRAIANWQGSNGAGKVSLGYTETVVAGVPASHVQVTTALGDAVTYDYISNQPYRKPDTIESAADGQEQLNYDTSTHVLTSKIDRRGFETDYTYGDGIHQTVVVEAKGTPAQRRIETDWDSSINRITAKRIYNAAGTQETRTQWSYNLRGQVISKCVIDSPNAPATVDCSPTASLPAGDSVHRWIYTYCEQADVTANTCPLIGLLKQVDGPRTDVSDVTSYMYYQTTDQSACLTLGGTCHHKGDLQTIQNALGQITTYVSYDVAGRLTRLKDANGTYTDMTYHPRGWLLSRTVRANSDGSVNSTLDATTSFAYDNVGNVTQVTQPDGSYLAYTYDDAHRLTKIQDNLGAYISYTLDAAGNKTKENRSSSSGGYIMNYVYDQISHLTKIVDNGGTAELTYQNPPEASPPDYFDGYDGNGNVVYSVDSNGVGTERQYDGLNRLIKTLQDHASASTVPTHDTTTQYAYDTRDNLVKVTDPDNLATTYTYNGFNFLKALSSPDTGNTSYIYDAAGNRKTQTDARGITSTYTYDALNRLTGITYPTTSLNVAYIYDTAASGCYNVGRLVKITDSSGTTYCYDRRGNVLSKVEVAGGVTLTNAYSYTLADRLLTLTYPGGAIVTYGRDATGHATSVKYQASAGAASTTLVSNVTYYPFGPNQVITFGNGRTLTKAYHSNYQIGYVQSSVASGLHLYMTPDAYGNIKNASISSGLNPPTASYKYDNLYRLTEVDKGSTVAEQYTYGLTGDRLSATVAGTTSTYTYTPGTHRLAGVGGVARNYDPNGNLLTNTSGTLAYDDRNRLVALNPGTPPTGTPESRYDYNGRGEQVLYQVGTAGSTLGSQYRPYDESGHVLGQYTNTGYARQQFIYMDGQLITETAYGTLYYVETDHLGTPRVIADTANNNAWTWDFFGNAFGANAPVATTFTHDLRFPGQYFDVETGLNYNYFRDYEPGTGRYVESDPIGLSGGISTYGYVSGNPLASFDVLGLVQHVSGRWIDCGNGCRIRIDYTLDPKTNAKVNHLHWECKGDSGECGENGNSSHGGTWDDAPTRIKQCALAAGFQGSSRRNNPPEQYSPADPAPPVTPPISGPGPSPDPNPPYVPTPPYVPNPPTPQPWWYGVGGAILIIGGLPVGI